jgi:hypothetical protein
MMMTDGDAQGMCQHCPIRFGPRDQAIESATAAMKSF